MLKPCSLNVSLPFQLADDTTYIDSDKHLPSLIARIKTELKKLAV
jgi:hypothetical protein